VAPAQAEPGWLCKAGRADAGGEERWQAGHGMAAGSCLRAQLNCMRAAGQNRRAREGASPDKMPLALGPCPAGLPALPLPGLLLDGLLCVALNWFELENICSVPWVPAGASGEPSAPAGKDSSAELPARWGNASRVSRKRLSSA